MEALPRCLLQSLPSPLFSDLRVFCPNSLPAVGFCAEPEVPFCSSTGSATTSPIVFMVGARARAATLSGWHENIRVSLLGLVLGHARATHNREGSRSVRVGRRKMARWNRQWSHYIVWLPEARGTKLEEEKLPGKLDLSGSGVIQPGGWALSRSRPVPLIERGCETRINLSRYRVASLADYHSASTSTPQGRPLAVILTYDGRSVFPTKSRRYLPESPSVPSCRCERRLSCSCNRTALGLGTITGLCQT